MKAIYFDMDGTIADLYNYDGWLEMLQNDDVTPYEECGILVDIEKLQNILNEFYLYRYQKFYYNVSLIISSP